MDSQWKMALLKVFAGVFTNLSAAWFGAALIFPIFQNVRNQVDVTLLILNIINGTIYVGLAIVLERELLS